MEWTIFEAKIWSFFAFFDNYFAEFFTSLSQNRNTFFEIL